MFLLYLLFLDGLFFENIWYNFIGLLEVIWYIFEFWMSLFVNFLVLIIEFFLLLIVIVVMLKCDIKWSLDSGIIFLLIGNE